MRAFILISGIVTGLVCQAQTFYISSGIGSNSGAQATPYLGSNLLIPWWVEAEMQVEVEKVAVSFYVTRRVNHKAGEGLLSGVGSESRSYYYGMKIGRRIAGSILNSDIVRTGFLLSYGLEHVSWNGQTCSLFPAGCGTKYGRDKFSLLQTGFYSSVTWIWSRFHTRLNFAFSRDFVLRGERLLNPDVPANQQMVRDFDHRGLFSLNLSGSLGWQMWKK